MPFSRFKMLTFDVVGTLIDFEGGILAYLRSVATGKAAALSDDELLDVYRRARQENLSRTSEAMADVYLRMAKMIDLPTGAREAEGFQLAVLNLPAFPDSVAALKRLRKHFRLVAMTNADRVAYSQYAHRLDYPFDDSVTSDETGVHKPDPRFFVYTRGRQSAFGYTFEETLHVAQSQYHDIGVARELGYTICWIERRKGLQGYGGTPDPKTVTKPDFHFATLAELADAVEASLVGKAA